MSCGAETEANTLLTALLTGEDVALPVIDYDDDIFKIPADVLEAIKKGVHLVSNDDLTTTQISGSGTFDVMMRAHKAHLQIEYEGNRQLHNTLYILSFSCYSFCKLQSNGWFTCVWEGLDKL